MLNYNCFRSPQKILERGPCNTICSFPNCNKNAPDRSLGLCPTCSHKICKYEERLDRWLATFHPDLALEDVMGWYCKCIKEECDSDCLETDFHYPGCTCCPCNRQLGYIARKINHQMYPDEEWIRYLRIQINDF